MFKPKIKKTQTIDIQFQDIMNKNKAFYTHCQLKKAKKAKNLCHALGTLLIKNIKAIFQINMITNNLITIKDIKIS